MSLFFKTVVEKMGLKFEPPETFLQHYWVDKTTQSITQSSTYHDCLRCDALDINVVLFGRTWLYDLDMTCFGRSNTHEFKLNGKRIVLKPS